MKGRKKKKHHYSRTTRVRSALLLNMTARNKMIFGHPSIRNSWCAGLPNIDSMQYECSNIESNVKSRQICFESHSFELKMDTGPEGQ